MTNFDEIRANLRSAVLEISGRETADNEAVRTFYEYASAVYKLQSHPGTPWLIGCIQRELDSLRRTNLPSEHDRALACELAISVLTWQPVKP